MRSDDSLLPCSCLPSTLDSHRIMVVSSINNIADDFLQQEWDLIDDKEVEVLTIFHSSQQFGRLGSGDE